MDEQRRRKSGRLLAGVACAGLAAAGCVSHLGVEGPGRAHEDRTGSFRVERDVVYDAAATPPLEADLYVPDGKGPLPAVLVVHGGGWTRGHRRDMDHIAERLAERGYVAVNLSYRFAPAHHHPAQVEDCRRALRWMRDNAARYRIDPDRIGAFGYSAGAHLAALLATMDPAAAGGAAASLKAAVAGGTPADLRRFAGGDLVPRFLGASYDENPALYESASPIAHVSAGDPPMFLYHGTWDWIVPVSQAREMKQALDAAGVEAELYLVHGIGHSALFLWNRSSVEAAIDFLDRRL